MRRWLVMTAMAAALAACGESKPQLGEAVPGGRMAIAQLKSPDGTPIGRAVVREVAGGLRVTLDVKGLTPGLHGAHVHTVGRCDAPDFASAGGHWNPTGAQHGSMNPKGMHMGDLPNLMVGADGRGTLGFLIPGGTMDGLLDADGAALVVHAAPDDLMTDPSGNSGGRVACGVLTAG